MTRAKGHIRPRASKKQKQCRPAEAGHYASSEYYVSKDGIGAVPRPAGVPRAAFGLVVKGDCLHPRVRDGQVLIVQKGSPKPGELAVVWTKGINRPQVKIFRRRSSRYGLALEQINPPRELVIKPGNIQCLMRVHSVVEAPQ